MQTTGGKGAAGAVSDTPFLDMAKKFIQFMERHAPPAPKTIYTVHKFNGYPEGSLDFDWRCSPIGATLFRHLTGLPQDMNLETRPWTNTLDEEADIVLVRIGNKYNDFEDSSNGHTFVLLLREKVILNATHGLASIKEWINSSGNEKENNFDEIMEYLLQASEMERNRKALTKEAATTGETKSFSIPESLFSLEKGVVTPGSQPKTILLFASVVHTHYFHYFN